MRVWHGMDHAEECHIPQPDLLLSSCALTWSLLGCWLGLLAGYELRPLEMYRIGWMEGWLDGRSGSSVVCLLAWCVWGGEGDSEVRREAFYSKGLIKHHFRYSNQTSHEKKV